MLDRPSVVTPQIQFVVIMLVDLPNSYFLTVWKAGPESEFRVKLGTDL